MKSTARAALPSGSFLKTALALVSTPLVGIGLVLALAAGARAAPPATISEASEAGLDLTPYAGRVVYVDFWASWCKPCQASFPWMQALQDSLGAQGLTVVTVNVDSDRKAADRFLIRQESTLPVVWDSEGEIARAYALQGMPSSFLYDRSGRLQSSHVGFTPDEAKKLGPELEAMLAKEDAPESLPAGGNP
jgi:thiol-disulfide isomerase/thioredoxin